MPGDTLLMPVQKVEIGKSAIDNFSMVTSEKKLKSDFLPEHYGMLHFPLYTFSNEIPILGDSSLEKCKLLLTSYEGCQHYY